MKKTKKIFLLSTPILLLPIVAFSVVSCSSKQSTDSQSITSSTSNSSTNYSAISNYINAINSLPTNTILVNNEGQNILPSQCNSTNLLQYLSNVPSISTDIIYNIVILSTNDNNGNIIFNISFPESNSNISTASFYVDGFLTQNQSNINNFINQINTIGPSLIGNSSIYPNAINSSNFLSYLAGMPTIPSGITLTYTTFNVSNGNGCLQVIISASAANATMVSSNEITINGFKSNVNILKSQIGTLNLQANTIMPTPIITSSSLSLQNAQSILTSFNINASQNELLNQIKDLSISVTNSSITTGAATLEFSANIDGYTTSYSQQYSGFFIGTSSQIQTHLQTYLADSTNAASFLQNYLTVNQSFLTNLVINTDTGNAYWGYSATSPNSNTNNFNNIAVVYDTTTQTYNLTATTTNTININGYNGSNFVFSGVIPTGTQVTIVLPFLFSGTLANYSSINITVTDSGSVTLSWNSAQFTHYQQSIGISTKYTAKSSSSSSNLLIPWRTPSIPDITF